MLVAVSDEAKSTTSRRPLEQSVGVFIHPTVAGALLPRPVNACIRHLSIKTVVTNVKKPTSLHDIDASTTGQIQAFKLRAGI
jgi:hypothetical protein